MLAPSKDGRSLYALDAVTGELIVHERNGKPPRKVADSLLNVEAFAVGHKHELYLAHSDSTVRIVGSDGRRLNAFRTVYPRSVAVLGNGNVVVASPFNGKNLHLYNGQGLSLASFGDIRPFDASQTENEFLNQGRVVVGPGDQIYYVSTYAPEPYVLRFSSEGQLLGEFQIEGEAVDLQTDLTREFLSRRGFCNGGFTIITSASVNPETGHLWLGMNGMSTQGTVYEYDQTGTKLREFALLLDSNNKRENVTHVRDIVVSGDSLSVLTWGGTFGFKLSEVLIVDAWKVPTKTSKNTKPTRGAWANPFAGITKFWEPAPVIRPGIPQPVQGSCPIAQVFTCTANCPTGTQPNPADCGAQIGAVFGTGQSKRVTQSTCMAQTVNSTPGAENPGGCSQSINWCDTNSGVTGTHTVTVNCTAVPTPTPTPEPTPTPGGGGGCPNGTPEECHLLGCYECTCFEGLCSYATPILIDVSGNGFDLTNTAGGVDFDLNNDGVARRVAWTAMGSDDGWLALDRNGNGLVDRGMELFGDVTPQPLPPAGVRQNGFLALAEFDKPANGGNGDAMIDHNDAIFSSLLLWQDKNHNGISEVSELHKLFDLNVQSISLDFKESRRIDRYGNSFRYRAKVTDSNGAQLGRWAWDVILGTQ
ncbi:MAG TPA: hypothetical protein VFR78_10625 [Pyrinomonadaceae bacterium]|nr:hypothetical protein [Pyrinomonadaceae bacterium]